MYDFLKEIGVRNLLHPKVVVYLLLHKKVRLFEQLYLFHFQSGFAPDFVE